MAQLTDDVLKPKHVTDSQTDDSPVPCIRRLDAAIGYAALNQ